MYIDRLDKINDKYINTYHRKVEIKPTDVNVASYTDFSAVHNKKDPKFKFGDHVKIIKYKNIFATGYTTKSLKNNVPWTYTISNFTSEKNNGIFYQKEL